MGTLRDKLFKLAQVVRSNCLVQIGVPMRVKTLILLLKKVVVDGYRGIHVNFAHVLALNLWTNEGLRGVIDEFFSEIERYQGGISEKKQDAHCERELSWAVPSLLVVNSHLDNELRQVLKEKLGEELDLKAILEGGQLQLLLDIQSTINLIVNPL